MNIRGACCGLLILALGTAQASAAWYRVWQHGQVSHGAAPGYLGVDVRDVGEDEVAGLKLKDVHGAEITRVDHDGPAGQMDLRVRDVVIQMNGTAITNEEQIRRMLHETSPGQAVALVVMRDGSQMTLTAQMADRAQVERQAWERHLSGAGSGGGPQAPPTGLPSSDTSTVTGPSIASGPAPTTRYSKSFLGSLLMTPSYTGVMLERMGPQLAVFFGVPHGTGMLVKAVEDNSPAAMAGIKAGDVVVRADTRTVTTMTDWSKAVRDAKGRPVTVVILRDRQEKILTLVPDGRKHSQNLIPLPWERAADPVRVAALSGRLNGL